MAYININKRVRKLAKIGFLEQLKPVNDLFTINIHGRKDYKITTEGMKQLVPYVMHHHKISDKIIEYIDKAGLKREVLEPLLINEFKMTQNRVENMIGMADAINLDESLQDFLSFMGNISEVHILMKKEHFEELRQEMRKSYFGKKLDTAAQGKERTKRKQPKGAIKHKRKSN